MEKKTIGSFIAVLRKANGLTQKELADKLGISDKAVSRWERDETAPDISLIPTVAEILGVTTDELLRGERITDISFDGARTSERSEKQIKTLLKNTRTKLYTRTLICILIAVVGLFAAMICNCVFYKMMLGFIVACIFISTSVVLGIIFTYLARSSISEEDMESAIIAETRKYIIKKETLVFYVNAVIFAFCLPLCIFGVNTGIAISAWLVLGGLMALAALLICAIVNIFIDFYAEKHGLYDVVKVNAKRRKNARIFGRPALSLCKVFVPLFVVVLVAQIFCMSSFDTYYFMEKNGGTEWNNIEEFKEYIETETYNVNSDHAKVTNTFYDQEWVEIATEVIVLSDDSEEYYPKTELYNSKGDVICEFEYRNKDVYVMSPSTEENGLPITTYTWNDFYVARSDTYMIVVVAVIVYIVMAAAFIALYIFKTVKAYKKEKAR